MGQIVFVTLFLGLAIGRVPVELLVTGDVVKVELVLDHQVVATIDGPPWKAPVDLGFALAPHRLEARGYDANGRVVTSVEQKVNSPTLVRELRLVTERRGADAVARILWTSLDAPTPDAVEARIDNRLVAVNDDLTVPLPRLDAETVHLLEVTVRSDAGNSEAQLVFGGMFEDSASATLTAVPVRISGRRVSREGVVAKVNDAAVRVMALDDLPAEVIFVREPLTLEFAHLAKKQMAYESLPGGRAPSSAPRIIGDAALDTKDRVRFIWPVSRSGRSGTNASLFYPSRAFTTTNATGIGTLLGRVSLGRPATELRFADAIAVAGWQAAQSQRPRAVVLVLGSHLDDASHLQPEQARNYLDRLGVPLYVWSVVRETPPAAKVWGEVIDIRTGAKLRGAVERLRRDLDTQRILWVEGDYLATEVTVAHERVTALVR